MKRLFVAVALLVATAGTAAAQATIVGSSHDLRTYTGDGGTLNVSEICIFCHTPHNASIAVPLWNHATDASGYTMYGGSSTIQGTIAGAPAGVSLMCLGCHDGVTGIDAFGGATGTVNIPAGDPHVMGKDLSNDHPISITYRNDLDGDLVAPTGATVGTLPLFGSATPYTVECGSCHNPHGAGAGLTEFLRLDNAASALCLTCHSK